MKTIMNIDHLSSVEQIQAFLEGSQPIAFKVTSTADERYHWVKSTLIKFKYSRLKRCERGILIRFLRKISGYSKSQMTRLIAQYKTTGKVIRHQSTSNGFERKYTDKDIRLIVAMDARHETPNGASIKKLCERACHIYNDSDYERLAGISISHIYNLRQSEYYKKRRRHVEKTKYAARSMGERRKPEANGKPGYIRIDTVHQGDLDGVKGVYHINAVDAVTQYEVVVSVEKISERYLIPALELLLKSFPFDVKGFHSDNGSEYINNRVAKLLKKLLIEFTKSRPRHSGDNGLVETKNGAVIRKLFGHMHIPQHWADRINEFNMSYLNPVINYHRPCFFPERVIKKSGKIITKYPYKKMMTPYEKLKSLEDATQYLKTGITFKMLDQIERKMTDSEAVDKLNQAKKELFRHINEQNKECANG